MLKAILFDLGDTLFDFSPVSTHAVLRQAGRRSYDFLRARGHSLPAYDEYFARHAWAMRRAYGWSFITRREFNCHHVLRRTTQRMGLSLEEPTLRELGWKWYEPVAEHATVAPDVIPTLSRLRDRGLELGLVSNTCIPGYALDRHLRAHDLLELLPVRIYSSDTRFRKPHPTIFKTALRAMGVTATSALFVGDKVKNDILGAQRIGMRAILRHRGRAPRNSHLADFVIRRLSELMTLLPHLDAPPSSVELPLEALVSET
jgi:putative hydrolase of the HAD superfamily